MTAPPTTRLEAYQAFAAALCQFQRQAADHGTTAALLASAHEFGFCWFSRPATEALGTEMELAHVSGISQVAVGAEDGDPSLLLLGLLGVLFHHHGPVTLDPAPQPAEPDPEPGVIEVLPPGKQIIFSNPAQPEPPAAQAAAESLAAATGGAVFELAEGDPALTPLTDEQKAMAVQMVKDLTEAQRKEFAIAFRNAFGVDRKQKSIIPLIAELRHLEFIDRFTVEAAGGVAP